MAKLANAQGEDTHTARANQHHGEALPDTGHPGEGSVLRYGVEARGEDCEVEPTKTEKRRMKGAKPGYFNVNRYSCWMIGNGQKGR